MRSSYRHEDVEILLKDITGLVAPEETAVRERRIQAGRHYCEMLPVEYAPSSAYIRAYENALRQESRATARAVGILSDRIAGARGRNVVLVSLARAGIPMGILIKRYLRKKYGWEVPHYAVSIIRGRGIDRNAMRAILKKHAAANLLFVDGWVGKGAIFTELRKETAVFPGVSPELAVAADPALVTELCGTHQDILIPSSCLNCTVSGLISRTFLRSDIIGPEDFHGAVYYGELAAEDRSYEFIEAVESRFQWEEKPEEEGEKNPGFGLSEVKGIAEAFGISDINLIKPGIGEATRVLLRRVPWKILIGEKGEEDPSLAHLKTLAEEKHVPVEVYPLRNYRACGIIRNLADA
ncbi:MAG: cysteine protease StiP family protein [Lachnospiraceae bacterium]|nr:cysteine protease StiP family protein [Lachnospiraceae bacterium]